MADPAFEAMEAQADEATGSNGNLALAFGLTLAAAGSTAFGAAIVAFAKQTNTRLLAAALGASGGVMLFISFAEILSIKSPEGFVEAGYTDAEAVRYAYLTFFAGMLLIWLLDKLTHFLLHLARRGRAVMQDNSGLPETQLSTANSASSPMSLSTQSTKEGSGFKSAIANPCFVSAKPGATAPNNTISPNSSNNITVDCAGGATGCDVTGACEHGVTRDAAGNTMSICRAPHDDEAAAVLMLATSKGKSVGSLARMGLLAALAICIHNFPEGIATFVGTMADPTTGIVIAIAIILHNIPEGVIVAVPVYYATGSKWKALAWGSATGISEPLGALLGWAVLGSSDMSPLAYALIFGFVSGIMVYIVLAELLPQAYAYDPDDTVTTKGLVCGMIVMAVSILLFEV